MAIQRFEETNTTAEFQTFLSCVLFLPLILHFLPQSWVILNVINIQQLVFTINVILFRKMSFFVQLDAARKTKYPINCYPKKQNKKHTRYIRTANTCYDQRLAKIFDKAINNLLMRRDAIWRFYVIFTVSLNFPTFIPSKVMLSSKNVFDVGE